MVFGLPILSCIGAAVTDIKEQINGISSRPKFAEKLLHCKHTAGEVYQQKSATGTCLEDTCATDTRGQLHGTRKV